jgi:hypothetical protein
LSGPASAPAAPEREPGIDDLVRQDVSGESTALDDGVEPDLLGVANAVGEFDEGLAVVEIRGVNDVSGGAELIGEREAPRRQSLCVMEHQNLSHVGWSLARTNPLVEKAGGKRGPRGRPSL